MVGSFLKWCEKNECGKKVHTWKIISDGHTKRIMLYKCSKCHAVYIIDKSLDHRKRRNYDMKLVQENEIPKLLKKLG